MKGNNEHLHKLLHDIKSPITSVLGFSEFLKKSISTKDLEKEQIWSETINTEAKKIKDLIEEITQEVKKLK